MKLKQGDLINVFQCHLTDENSEGKALLVRFIGGPDEDGYEQWRVSFPEGSDTEVEYYRVVHRRNLVTKGALSPEDFAAKMKEISIFKGGDPEAAHCKMDNAIMALLESLGYTAAVEIFRHTDKWYA